MGQQADDGMSQQLLILVKGLPGSGKSTVAAALARELRCPLVDKDDARDCFQSAAQQAPHVDWNALAYGIMFRVAARQLALGLSVVVDCPFSRRQLYDEACEVARQAAATAAAAAAGAGDAASPGTAGVGPLVEVVLVDMECSDEAVWRRRLEARGARDRDTERAHKPGSWEALQALLTSYRGSWRWSTDGSVDVRHHVRLDTAYESTEGCVRLVRDHLQNLQPSRTAAPRRHEGSG